MQCVTFYHIYTVLFSLFHCYTYIVSGPDTSLVLLELQSKLGRILHHKYSIPIRSDQEKQCLATMIEPNNSLLDTQLY